MLGIAATGGFAILYMETYDLLHGEASARPGELENNNPRAINPMDGGYEILYLSQVPSDGSTQAPESGSSAGDNTSTPTLHTVVVTRTVPFGSGGLSTIGGMFDFGGTSSGGTFGAGITLGPGASPFGGSLVYGGANGGWNMGAW